MATAALRPYLKGVSSGWEAIERPDNLAVGFLRNEGEYVFDASILDLFGVYAAVCNESDLETVVGPDLAVTVVHDGPAVEVTLAYVEARMNRAEFRRGYERFLSEVVGTVAAVDDTRSVEAGLDEVERLLAAEYEREDLHHLAR